MMLAANVIRENLRNRVLYLLVGIGLLLMFAMLAGQGGKMSTQDGTNLLDTLDGVMRAGFALVGALGSLVTVVLTMNTIPREYERQTIHLVLVRPVARWEVAGAFLLGNIVTAWLFLAAMATPLFAALAVRGATHLMPELLVALPALALNTAMIAGLTTLFSSRMPGAAAAFLGLLAYGLGAFSGELGALALASKSAGAPLARVLLWAVPPTGPVSGEALKLFIPGMGLDGRVFVTGLIYLWAVAGLTAASLYRREV
jgi:ABC-type transport system involved in multi-copper enzyme maturation permease subunit